MKPMVSETSRLVAEDRPSQQADRELLNDHIRLLERRRWRYRGNAIPLTLAIRN